MILAEGGDGGKVRILQEKRRCSLDTMSLAFYFSFILNKLINMLCMSATL